MIAALRQRAVEYAGRHALAFALWRWRWRAALEDRTALKQRVRALEAELARPGPADERLVAPVARCLAQLDGRFIGAAEWERHQRRRYEARARRVLATIGNARAGNLTGGLPPVRAPTAPPDAACGPAPPPPLG